MKKKLRKIIIVNPAPITCKIGNLIAGEFKKRGVEAEILTDRKSIEISAKKDNLKVTNVYSLLPLRYKYSEKRFISYLKKYNIDFEDFCFDEIIKPFERRKTVKKRLLTLFVLFEKYLQNKKQDCIFNFSHTLVDRIIFKVAEKMKILNIHCRPNSPVISWAFGLSYKWNDIIKKEFLHAKIDKKTHDKISAYISKIVSGVTLITVYDEDLKTMQISEKAKLRENFKDLYNYVFVDNKILENIFFPLHFFLKETLIKKIRSILAKTYYSEPNFNEKFVYFPLQVPNDAAITVRAPKFYRQDLIADIISRALPSGHFLYVKEHPNEKGAIPLYWIKRISSIPNVKLVPVNTSSHYLIKNSRAVIVITSETGWEGLLYLKPVIVLGNPFYSKLGITFDVEKIEDLPKIIKKALRTEKVDKHRVYKVIYALIKSSCDCTSSLISLGNKDISKIVDFVIKEYDYRTMKMR